MKTKKAFLTLRLEDLIPYENNPRINDDAVKEVAESIKQTGNLDPIEIDENNVILSGHTRLKALLQLGYTETECIRFTGLSEAQKRKYRLLTNKTGEAAKWDFDKLAVELDGLDFEGFDFEFRLPEFRVFGDERERTYNLTNLNDYDEQRADGWFQMPTLKACDYIPKRIIGFNYVKTAKEFDCGVHFFLDDYQFERVWNRPNEYIPKLDKFECVFTPDWSLYVNMPRAMQIWNIYRARLIGQRMQDWGLRVIPTLSWADKESYDFCFEGLPRGGCVAVSSVGVMREQESRELWCDGMREAIKRLRPKTVLCYGNAPDFDFGDTEVKYYETRKLTKKE